LQAVNIRDEKSTANLVDAMKNPLLVYSSAGIEDKIKPFSERRRRRYP